jgi:hypothetical protein
MSRLLILLHRPALAPRCVLHVRIRVAYIYYSSSTGTDLTTPASLILSPAAGNRMAWILRHSDTSGAWVLREEMTEVCGLLHKLNKYLQM